MSTERAMPLYQSHKIVEAAKIVEAVRHAPAGTAKAELDIRIEGATELIRVTEGPITYKPLYELLGGYLVRYADGYVSWSPADVFEAGYRRLPDTTPGTGNPGEIVVEVADGALPFGLALVAIQDGHTVSRAGWNGKGMFLFLVSGGEMQHPALPKPAVQSQDYVAMMTAQGSVVPWLASQSDILAKDWQIVGGPH